MKIFATFLVIIFSLSGSALVQAAGGGNTGGGTSTVITCSNDTDPNDNKYKPGSITIKKTSMADVQKKDECVSGKLIQYKCVGTSSGSLEAYIAAAKVQTSCAGDEKCKKDVCVKTAFECAPVDDNNLCTVESCASNGWQTVHTPKVCSKKNEVCDPKTGLCKKPDPCANLDDHDYCTVDSCEGGQPAHKPVNTDDGHACTIDACDSKTGKIKHELKKCPSGTCDNKTGLCKKPNPCAGKQIDDGNLCTGDACSNGQVTHTPKVCDEGETCNTETGKCGACVDKETILEKISSEYFDSQEFALPSTAHCTDLDYDNGTGLSITTKSSIQWKQADGTTKVYNDSCKGEKLYERFCNKNSPIETSISTVPVQQNTMLVPCPDGSVCSEGACVPAGNQLWCEGTGEPPVAKPVVSRLGLSASTVCWINNDGSVQCWGVNYSGQCGTQTNDENLCCEVPQTIQLSGKALDLSGEGGSALCAVIEDGTVECWGKNQYHVLGSGGLVAEDGFSAVPVKVMTEAGQLTGVVAVDVGGSHACAVTKVGLVYCWGDNYAHELGTSKLAKPAQTKDGQTVLIVDKTNSPFAMLVEGLNGAVDVSAAGKTSLEKTGGSSCALINDGSVRCWGAPEAYRPFSELASKVVTLINGVKLYPWTPPFLLTNLGKVIDFDSDSNHSCALLDDYHVRCFGNPTQISEYGLLGEYIGKAVVNWDFLTVDIQNLPKLKQIAVGTKHSCALDLSGKVTCWGLNNNKDSGTKSILGVDESVGKSAVPLQVMDPEAPGKVLVGIQEIVASHYLSCGLREGGGIVCWGTAMPYLCGSYSPPLSPSL